MAYILHTPRFHGDHRRYGWFDVFPTERIKDTNIVIIPKAGTIVAWHKHKIQTDFWFVIQGALEVGLFSCEPEIENKIGMMPENNHIYSYDYTRAPADLRYEVLSPQRGQVLEILPNTYHGYKSLVDNTVLVYGLTEKYNPDDELRLDFNKSGAWFQHEVI